MGRYEGLSETLQKWAAEDEAETQSRINEAVLHERKRTEEIVEMMRAALINIASVRPCSEVPDPSQENEAEMWAAIARKRKELAREALAKYEAMRGGSKEGTPA